MENIILWDEKDNEAAVQEIRPNGKYAKYPETDEPDAGRLPRKIAAIYAVVRVLWILEKINSWRLADGAAINPGPQSPA